MPSKRHWKPFYERVAGIGLRLDQVTGPKIRVVPDLPAESIVLLKVRDDGFPMACERYCGAKAQEAASD